MQAGGNSCPVVPSLMCRSLIMASMVTSLCCFAKPRRAPLRSSGRAAVYLCTATDGRGYGISPSLSTTDCAEREECPMKIGWGGAVTLADDVDSVGWEIFRVFRAKHAKSLCCNGLWQKFRY